MSFLFDFSVDLANKMLVCEVRGQVIDIVDIEHLLKNIIKTAGKNQVKNVVLDVSEFTTSCSNVEIAKLMIIMQKQDWLGELKIARIISPQNSVHSNIDAMAVSLSLAIKSFESRSRAMLWLLFDKAD